MKRYTLGLYEKALPNALSIAEKLTVAKKSGYDFLEISIDETDEKLARLDWSPAQRRAVTAAIQETGIPIRTMCLSGHRRFPLGSMDAAVRERSLQIMQKAIALACDIGVQIIQLAGYDTYYEPGNEQTRAYFVENLFEATEMAACESVLLGFETMETPLMNTVEKAMKYVKRIDNPYLNVYPDVGNITNALLNTGVSVEQDLNKGKGHLVALHIKETKPGVYRDMNYGEGHVDFKAAIGAACALGVRRFVTEYWHDRAQEHEARAARTQARFRSIIAECVANENT